jgi:hypothetical protein
MNCSLRRLGAPVVSPSPGRSAPSTRATSLARTRTQVAVKMELTLRSPFVDKLEAPPLSLEAASAADGENVRRPIRASTSSARPVALCVRGACCAVHGCVWCAAWLRLPRRSHCLGQSLPPAAYRAEPLLPLAHHAYRHACAAAWHRIVQPRRRVCRAPSRGPCCSTSTHGAGVTGRPR